MSKIGLLKIIVFYFIPLILKLIRKNLYYNLIHTHANLKMIGNFYEQIIDRISKISYYVKNVY